MRAFVLDHLSDADLRRGLFQWGSQERASIGMFIAHIAEFDRRRLYVPDGYSSMFVYCVRELKLSEGAAYRRIRAARAARKYPEIFDAVTDGRLHLTAVVLLAPHLTPENREELLQAAEFKDKAAVELLLADRFPRPDVRPRITALGPRAMGHPDPFEARDSLFREPLETDTAVPTASVSPEPAQMAESELTLASVKTPLFAQFSEGAEPTVRQEPPTPRRFSLQLTVDEEFHDLLQRALGLMSHSAPTGDVATVLKRSLVSLVEKLERRKFGAADRPQQQSVKCSQGTNDSCPREASRMEAGSGALHVRQRIGPPVWVAPFSGIRSHRARRPRRAGDRGWHTAAMPRAQSLRSGEDIWGRVHEGAARSLTRRGDQGIRTPTRSDCMGSSAAVDE